MEELKKRRGAARGWLSRAIKNTEDLLDPEVSCDKIDLEESILELNKRWNLLEEIQLKIEETQSSDESKSEQEEADVYYNRALNVRKNARRKLEAVLSKNQPGMSENAEYNANMSNGNTDHGYLNVRLPKLSLPTFSGDVTKFKEFWDQFEVAVNKTNIPAVTKFTYLKGLVEGEAKATIDGLSLTSEHYEIACNLLTERYGRTELAIFSHIQSLINLKQKEHHKSQLDKLKGLLDEINVHVRSLEALDISGSKYGIALTPVILSRLPESIRMEWAKESKGREGDLKWLLTFLKSEIERRERANSFQMNKISEEERKPAFRSKIPSAAALHTATRNNAVEAYTCIFCHRSNHNTDDCWTVKRIPFEKRKTYFIQEKCCFRCAKVGHQSKNCKATCEKCQGQHHKTLCTTAKKEEEPFISTDPSVSCVVQSIEKRMVLQIAKVRVKGKYSEKNINVLFDSGSDKSYVTADIVRQLKLNPVQYTTQNCAVFGGEILEKKRAVVDIGMLDSNGKKIEVRALQTPVICVPLERPRIPKDLLTNKGIELEDVFDKGKIKIDMLIGLDNYWKLMTTETVRIDDNNLVAQKSLFGWVISGQLNSNEKPFQDISTGLLVVDNPIEAEVRRFWDLDHIGILKDETNKEDCLIKNFEETVEFVDGRYVVELPWKEQMKPVDNENLAMKRMWRQYNKIAQHPELKKKYEEVFREWEDNGIIEEVPPKDAITTDSETYYLPHRPVIREDHSTTKIRPVFDASAKTTNGLSLNDCLHAGPKLLKDLVEVLLRFRRHKFALVADITKAFLQIGIKDKEKNFHRFLLCDGEKVRKMRFSRLTFGVNSSPFLLIATIKYHLSRHEDSRVKSELEQNLYMDDWLSGADSIQEVSKMYFEAQDIMNKAGMSLAKWNTNCKDLFETEVNSQGSTKVLGVGWSSSDDTFYFSGLEMSENLVVTKRIVLSVLSRIFDPLGLIGPVIMTGKILFQQLWKIGTEWDDEVPDEMKKKYRQWTKGFDDIENWCLPRRYFQDGWKDSENLELHIFSDASELAYGAVVYLVNRQANQSETMLVMSKSRVAPLKKITVPRLELLGCLLASRLLNFVQNALHIPASRYYCWTDSQVSLGWIKGDPFKYKQFVANRVTEIQELTDPTNWKHVKGKENPADLLTRGLSATAFTCSKIWIEGPTFLKQPINNLVGQVTQREVEEELCLKVNAVMVVANSKTPERILEVTRYSSLSKAVGVAVKVLSFVNKLKGKIFKPEPSLPLPQEVTEKRDESAKLLLIKQEQSFYFHEEMDLLKLGKGIPKRSKLYRLNPFLDDQGVIRSKGRLQNAEMSYGQKHPVILEKSWFSKLITREVHERLKHPGVDTIICEVRREFWIIGLRRISKEVIKECMSCQKVMAKLCSQEGAPLPSDRVCQKIPFEVTGVDYAGPLYVSDHPGNKMYICLFTCATIRAIHLELTDSMTTDTFLYAFRKFVARRGLPTVVYSDNAKTFKGAQNGLKAIYHSHSPKWKFIVPRAPWWGGFWERMVKNVKQALRKCLGNSVVTKEELTALLFEIEYAINSRPLTAVTDDIDDQQAITPNDFLMCGHITANDNLLDSFQGRKDLLLGFWKVWYSRYLSGLPKCVPQFQQGRKFDIGSVVVVQEDGLSRQLWPLGVIKELFYGSDGKVRSVSVKTKGGSLMRPVQRLCILEAARPLSEVQPKSDKTEDEDCVNLQDNNKKTVVVKFIGDNDIL